MTHISLFTGIGGIDLAAEWAGFETILQVENNEYCNRVLERHWPDVRRHGDIRTLDATSFSVDLVSGGFPCQPFSSASRGRAVAEDMWPEMLRVIRESGPRFVLAENVQRKPMAGAAADIARLGYRSALLAIPAATVGTAHYRARWFLAAHSYGDGEWTQSFYGEMASLSIPSCLDVWEELPDGLRMDDGVPKRMDRLQALGNAVVPQQVYPILRAIKEVSSDLA